jgi:tRNA A37 threonylcarbamoyladenosine modification protein TsaB
MCVKAISPQLIFINPSALRIRACAGLLFQSNRKCSPDEKRGYMNILGIESSCDETAAAVVENGRLVKSNIVASSLEEHKLYGGVVPEIASRRHAECISAVVAQALEKAYCTLDDIDAIAVTYAPGLIGALLVGVNFAKGLAAASASRSCPFICALTSLQIISRRTLSPRFYAS